MRSLLLKNTLLAISLLTALTNCVFAWTPGVDNKSATSGFTVDRQSRNDVISFYHAVYKESEGYELRINWTGPGAPGTTSAAFKGDVQRRINYYRAMAGIRADIDMTSTSTVYLTGAPSLAQPDASTTKEVAAQAAAYMRSRNSSSTDNPHDPPSSWTDDGPEARNGAYRSNISLGLYGPGAIDAYIYENNNVASGAVNEAVGHRRWIFSSTLKEVATGDVTASGSDKAANALYVVSDNLRANEMNFVAWPSAGFFPEPILFRSRFWSLSYPGADFSSATVTMTDAGGDSISVTKLPLHPGYADPTLVWEPAAESILSATTQDRVYHVTVSGILINDTSQDYSYTVTIINPNRLLKYPALSGSENPPDSGAKYFFDAIEGADAYELDVSKLAEVSWTAGAEDGTEDLTTDQTDASYELRSTLRKDVGSKSYRLSFAKNEYVHKPESFELTHTVIPRSETAALNFRMRRGYVASSSILRVQSSSDGGVTWGDLATYSGNSNNGPDSNFSSKSLILPSLNEETLVRFYFSAPDGAGVLSVDGASYQPSGVFIDQISFVNCDELVGRLTLTGANASSVMLDDASAGAPLAIGDNYILRLRAQLGGNWFAYGSSLEVTPVDASALTAYEKWKRSEYPFIGTFEEDSDGDGVANEVERIFNLNPENSVDVVDLLTPEIVDGAIELSHAVLPGIDPTKLKAEFSPDLSSDNWSPVPVEIVDGVATASFLRGDKTAGFLRWTVDP